MGKIGKDLTPEDGYDAAHHIALSLIATLKRKYLSMDPEHVYDQVLMARTLLQMSWAI